MKATIQPNRGISVEVEGASQKDLFKAVASAHEVFGERNCALCGSDLIVQAWRKVTVVKGKKTEEYEYPEYRCLARLKDGTACRARLALGTINDDTGTLYPIRKLVDTPSGQRPPNKEENEQGKGAYGPHRGWHRFNPNEDKKAA